MGGGGDSKSEQREAGRGRGREKGLGHRDTDRLRDRLSWRTLAYHPFPPGESAQRSADRDGRRRDAGYSVGCGPGASGSPLWPLHKPQAIHRGRRGKRIRPSSEKRGRWGLSMTLFFPAPWLPSCFRPSASSKASLFLALTSSKVLPLPWPPLPLPGTSYPQIHRI